METQMLEAMAEYIWIYFLVALPIVIVSGGCFLQKRHRPRDFLLVLPVSIVIAGIGGIPNLSGHGPSGGPPPFWIWFIWFYNNPGLIIHPVGWFGILHSVFISTIYILPSLLIGRVLVAYFEKWVSRPPRY